ncbi:MAG: aminoglycoside phosphotransferase family protein [Anaerolineales bacterium]|nr:aminoglycoside phosphotransferase family protein [Anaerolineales bacterium]
MKTDFAELTSNFTFEGTFIDAVPYGFGHINGTYLARFKQTDGTLHPYILQRINQNVFKCPPQVMHNMQRVTEHLRTKIADAGGDTSRGTINLIPTITGNVFYQAADGEYWRAETFILDAKSYLRATSLEHNYHAAYAFGTFQKMLSDFPITDLHFTIPDFHHTPKRLDAFCASVESDPFNRAREVQTEIDFVLTRARHTRTLIELQEKGAIPERVTHNDTKIDNVMIDDLTGEGVCVIDLDTVMPGLAVYDFGDAVRSGANAGAEDEPDLSKVWLDLEVFDRLTHGYLDAARDFLTPTEIDHLPFSAILMTLECGLRFLADHINGDVYFKTRRPHHNLDRARTQFKLIQDMETHFAEMVQIVAAYR